MEKSESIEERLSNIEDLLLSRKAVLNVKEVVKFTGMSLSHLYKLTSTRAIPHSKPRGKYMFFDRLELENWLMSNKVKTNEEIDSEAATYVTIGKR